MTNELLPMIDRPTSALVVHEDARRWVALRSPATELAAAIADSQFVPAGLRGKPDAILACIMFGDELGLGPMQSLARIAMIDGTPALRAETMRALVLAAGHELWVDEATTTRVTVSGKRLGSTRSSSVTWTIDDAKTAGLAGKPSYRAYPRQMLTARATAELVRIMFADVVGGLAAYEELDGEVQLEGEVGPAAPVKTSKRRRADKPTPEPEPEVTPQSLNADSPLREQLERVEVVGAEPTLDDALRDPELKSELVDPYAAELLEAVEAIPEPAPPATLEQAATANAGEPEAIDDKRMRKMQALFRELDVTRREPRLEYCATVIGRKLESSKELTIADADRVIDALTKWRDNPEGGPFGDGIPY